jgi:hypothetical protein
LVFYSIEKQLCPEIWNGTKNKLLAEKELSIPHYLQIIDTGLVSFLSFSSYKDLNNGTGIDSSCASPLD